MIRTAIYFFGLILSMVGCSSPSDSGEGKKNIALCIVATGKYDVFVGPLVASARQFFCTDQNVTFFVFTDGNIEEGKDVVKVYQKRVGWPFDTLKRVHIYEAHAELFERMDYVFAIDADVRFVGKVGDEILSTLVGTQHPIVLSKEKFPFEKNRKSTAYIKPKERESKMYFAGAFFGGKREAFLKLIRGTKKQIDEDIINGVMAKWHDESHLNRYFMDHRPTRILDTSYCAPEGWGIENRKILALDKEHGEMRN